VATPATNSTDTLPEKEDAHNLAIVIRGLVKRYPQAQTNAIDGLTLDIRRGEIFGFLGPNGAGKSTTIGVLTTRIVPDSGIVRVANADVLADPVTARSRIGVVPQRNNLDRSLSALDNLVYHATYHGWNRRLARHRAADLLAGFGLADRANDQVNVFSGGQVQRLMIARALMHQPEVLFMDEPSTGLDPQARLFVWERIRELPAAGVTVVLTTHDMHEAAELSDRIGIIDRGRLLALDEPDGLLRRHASQQTLLLSVEHGLDDTVPSLLSALSTADGVTRVDQIVDPARPARRNEVRARLHITGESARVLQAVLSLLTLRGAALIHLHAEETTMEDVFISLTGRSLR
jgi:ABC-2 type transport system ATP-binding protein